MLEQLDKVVADIDNEQLTRDEAIHHVRKRCKRIRAVLRLVHPVFGGDYEFENVFFRNAADRLAGLRDVKVLLETFDKVIRTRDGFSCKSFAAARERLIQHRRETALGTEGKKKRLSEVRKKFCKAHGRIIGWKLDTEGFGAIEEGLRETYARGRKGMRLAYRQSSAVNFHNWRKHVSHYRHHVRLLRKLRPSVFKQLLRRLERLCDLLGEDHDLALLRAALIHKAAGSGTKRQLRPLLDLIEKKSAKLRAKSRTIGKRIYAEKPKQLARRFRKHRAIL